MCGIAGIVDFSGQPIDPAILVAMRDRMLHRGPDDYGAVLFNTRSGLDNNEHAKAAIQFRNLEDAVSCSLLSYPYNVGLAHRRLSIIDASKAGRQPMCNEDGSVWITYNGEIYNFQLLREELKAAGHVFRSQTDTETVLHAYEQWGMDCLKRFIGMFAFGIWDGNIQELILARDRVGVKPIYYYVKGGKIIFASEIKAILENSDIVREVNEVAFYHYLSFHCVPPPLTLFKGIFKLEAGHYLIIKASDKIKDVHYWNMFKKRNEESINRREDDICHEILDLFWDATRLRMISDVPFGAFLSGGIDSSLNVAVMSQILKQPVNTFSIGFENASEFNELNWARKAANQFKTNHHETIISAQDTISFLNDMVYYQDEPIADSVCVPVYFLSKFAKTNGVTVCQVGEGSDELFCGYPTWLEALQGYSQSRHFGGRIQKVPMLLAAYLSSRILGFGWSTYERCLAFWNKREIFWGGAVAYRDQQKHAIISPLLAQKIPESTSEIISSYRKNFESNCYAPDDLTWMTYLDLRLRLPELLLMRLDKMNMAASLEGRVPFLDHRLVELAVSLPQKIKVNGNDTKYILKKAIRGILPDHFIDRPKQGFQLPVGKWYKEYLHHLFQETLEEFLSKTDYFNPKVLRRLAKRKGVAWIIINFILWHQRWIDRNLSP